MLKYLEPFTNIAEEPPEKLLDYLSRYTHRVAISNNRIVSSADGRVTFRYRDRADGDRRKTETLAAEEFIGRFLRHVLPDRFMRIRHYGFLASRNKRTALARIRHLLGAPPPPAEQAWTADQWFQQMLGIDPTACPCCGKRLLEEELPRGGSAVPAQRSALPIFARGPP